MEYFENLEQYRWFLYLGIIVASIGDVITTTIGIYLGHFEQNVSMAPYVGNPIMFSFIKTIACIFIIFLIEGIIRLLKKIGEYGKCAQCALFIGLIIGLTYTFAVVIINIIYIVIGAS
ncbi:MAG: hypothetical protein WCE46_02015 [Methanoregula sp.]|jgi:hypothetical protein|uniref:hypothetical protein n=1 Tax=Methanoregula sp. TaxID=2052170 RepID=UPI003C729D28